MAFAGRGRVGGCTFRPFSGGWGDFCGSFHVLFWRGADGMRRVELLGVRSGFWKGVVVWIVVDVVVLQLTILMVLFSSSDFATVTDFPKRIVEVVAVETHPVLSCCSRVVLHLRKPNQYYLIRYPLNLFYSAIRKTLVQIIGYSLFRIHLPHTPNT